MTLHRPLVHSFPKFGDIAPRQTTTPGAILPVTVGPHPLSLEALGAGGLPLRQLPLALLVEAVQPAELQSLGHLMHVGLLPVVPPRAREDLAQYAQRLGKNWQVEGFELDVQRHVPNLDFRHLPDPLTGELILTLANSQWRPPRFIGCKGLRRELERLHPRFFGSLMVHLSRASGTVWPIYTIEDALQTAMILRYHVDGDFADFWKDAKDEYQHEHKCIPRGRALKTYIEERQLTPAQLYRLIGLNEVLPALKCKLRLDLFELRALARPGHRPWLRTLLDQLSALQAVNDQIRTEMTQAEYGARMATGESQVCPVAALSGQTGDEEALHEVGELLLEEAQMAENGEGFCTPFTILVHDLASAQHALRLLSLIRQSLNLTKDLLDLFAD